MIPAVNFGNIHLFLDKQNHVSKARIYLGENLQESQFDTVYIHGFRHPKDRQKFQTGELLQYDRETFKERYLATLKRVSKSLEKNPDDPILQQLYARQTIQLLIRVFEGFNNRVLSQDSKVELLKLNEEKTSKYLKAFIQDLQTIAQQPQSFSVKTKYTANKLGNIDKLAIEVGQIRRHTPIEELAAKPAVT